LLSTRIRLVKKNPKVEISRSKNPTKGKKNPKVKISKGEEKNLQKRKKNI